MRAFLFLTNRLFVHPKYSIEERNNGGIDADLICVTHEMMSVVRNYQLFIRNSRLF